MKYHWFALLALMVPVLLGAGLLVVDGNAEAPADVKPASPGSITSALVDAVNQADADRLLGWTDTMNLCDQPNRDGWTECAGTDYVEAIWQIGYGRSPTPRPSETMRGWLTSLLRDNRATLLFVGHDPSQQGPKLVLFGFAAQRHVDQARQGPEIDLLALRVSGSEPPRIYQIGFWALSDLASPLAVDILENMAGYRPVIDFCADDIAAACHDVALPPSPTPAGPTH